MDFSFIAPIYAILEKVVFGGSLHRARVAHLDTIVSVLPQTASVLVAGDGDGRLIGICFFKEFLSAHRSYWD
ncbi:MAG: hypothetical protein P1U58_01305 [Verrucomicrobiales bacterium]|nr:hypothetical protein [Verrucomicrobiales bacterium]